MKLFDVYPRYDIEPVKGLGSFLWDKKGEKYLDLYCGHAVVSIGHSHPHYVKMVGEQLVNLGFYSNAVQIPLQEELATKLGELSGYEDYHLFLCNSGAEATENGLKVASFHTKRSKIIAFTNGFHGRTSLALEATDSPKILAPANKSGNIIRVPFGDLDAVKEAMDETIAGVVLEGIQGIAGIYEPDAAFVQGVKQLCEEHGALFISDEIQSGYGRSGRFFAHQHHGIRPDIITVGKGIGNGFPMAGVLISPSIEPWHGMLGTTFGGNHLACAAGVATLDVMKSENLITNAEDVGAYAIEKLKQLPGIVEVRGKGLMIAVELPYPVKDIRKKLLFDHHVFTGSSGNANTVRLLPPLSITKQEIDLGLEAFKTVLSS